MSKILLGGAALIALSLSANGAFALTPEQQYDQDMQRYREQQAQYEYQRGQYDRHLEGYYFARAHPRTWWRAAYFRAAPDWYWTPSQSALIGTDVVERDGRRVGQIVETDRTPEGHVDRVQIALNGHEAVWLNAEHIRLDHADRIAFVDLPEDELYDRANYRP
jgi:hypothetical protein